MADMDGMVAIVNGSARAITRDRRLDWLVPAPRVAINCHGSVREAEELARELGDSGSYGQANYAATKGGLIA